MWKFSKWYRFIGMIEIILLNYLMGDGVLVLLGKDADTSLGESWFSESEKRGVVGSVIDNDAHVEQNKS